MISSKGLFVFESKNYSGWIFGAEYQKNWCQTLPTGRNRSHKEYFYNPIMQNRSHIKHLKNLLDTQFPIHSIIVFSERCTLKRVEIKSDDIKVIKRNEVNVTVSEIYRNTASDVLNKQEIEDIYNKLYPYTQVDSALKEQHIKNIEKKYKCSANEKTKKSDSSVFAESLEKSETNISDKEENVVIEDNRQSEELPETTVNVNQLKCPKCGSDLILRTAVRGENAGKKFYGCSRYPKCRYIQNINE